LKFTTQYLQLAALLDFLQQSFTQEHQVTIYIVFIGRPEEPIHDDKGRQK